MQYRELGRTGWKISSIGMGMWAMGSKWGAADPLISLATLNKALDLGVNFFDTADVYGSEPLLGQLRRQRTEPFYIATKLGRKGGHGIQAYTRVKMTSFIEDSLKNLNVDTIDLIQLHCPPIEVLNNEVFSILDDLIIQGKIRHYGVSIERIDQAEKAIKFPNVQSVMIIFNIFRQRPAENFFQIAKDHRVGIIVRVPLASGLLSGRMTATTSFPKDDHRNFNLQGNFFDRGETFSGIDFETGLKAVEELRSLVPPGMTISQLALRWILMYDAVSCAIPGARNPSQVEENSMASELPPLSDDVMQKIHNIYDQYFRVYVHNRW